jgi:hypothetical protein
MQILASLHGRKVGLGAEGKTGAMKGKSVLISDGGFISGSHGSQFKLPSPSTVAIFDDFLGDVLADEWNAVETDTDGAQAVLAGGIGGVLRITSGNDDGNGVVLPDASGFTSYLNWQASNGGLEMQTRFKMSRITDAYFFIGFTDLVTIEAPIICNSAEGSRPRRRMRSDSCSIPTSPPTPSTWSGLQRTSTRRSRSSRRLRWRTITRRSGSKSLRPARRRSSSTGSRWVCRCRRPSLPRRTLRLSFWYRIRTALRPSPPRLITPMSP